MTGLLICGPVYCSEIERWPIEKSLYGSGEDHIKGDVFRVVVSYSNMAADSMRDAVGKIHYPDGVVPYPDKIYDRQLTKSPWPNHFVDEKRHYVRFELGSGPMRDYNEFYCYFEAEIYGQFEFDYSIEWTDVAGLRRRVTEDSQEIIIPDTIEIAEIPVASPRAYNSVLWPPYLKWVIVGAALVAGLLAGMLIRRGGHKKATQREMDIDELIEHFERENNELREIIAKEARKLDDANEYL